MDCSRRRANDPDDWLDLAPDFSRPIAAQLRDWILRCEPDLAEAIKWNMLCFSGRKLVCGISACKRHVSIAFFRGTELADPARLFDPVGEGNTNIRSIRLTALDGFDRRAFRGVAARGPGTRRSPRRAACTEGEARAVADAGLF
jgi:hypothetical protein